MNIKNIKVCPSGKDKSHRTVYVECDHDLQSEVKEQLENEKVQLGSPGTLKVFQHPEPMIIKKDEGLIIINLKMLFHSNIITFFVQMLIPDM